MYHTSLLLFVALISCSLCSEQQLGGLVGAVPVLGSLGSTLLAPGQVLSILGNGFLAVDPALLKCAFVWNVASGVAPAPTMVHATLVSDTSVTCVVPVLPLGVNLDLHVGVSIDGGLHLSNLLGLSILSNLCYKVTFVANLLFGLTNLLFSLLSILPLGVNLLPCPGVAPSLFGTQCMIVSGPIGLVEGVVNSVVALLSGLLGVVTGTIAVTLTDVCAAL